ncbi:GyrI-like domain-containing protein [Ruminococcaceae bacterium OttesenSCG-928-A11]|nr:GyrI-like domain-containing protein [Ruminococcaceae bacterium OttesenSCG-928-A11]
MEHRIEKMDAFRIVGVKLRSTNENMQGMKDIPDFWGEVMSQSKQMEILPLMDAAPMGLLGVSVYNSDVSDAKVFDYFIAVATTKPTPEGMEEHTVPAATWAVFPCKKDMMGQVQMDIFTKWMPDSGYRPLNSGYETGEMKSGAPDIELYTQGDDVEIWVPVEKV